MSILVFLLACLGCVSPSPHWETQASPTGIEILHPYGQEAVEVRASDGSLVSRHFPGPDLEQVWIPVHWPDHERVTLVTKAHGVQASREVQRPSTEDTVRVSVPLGQDSQALLDGKPIPYTSFSGARTKAGISLVAMDARPVAIAVGNSSVRHPHPTQGQRINFVTYAIGGDSIAVQIGDSHIDAEFQAKTMGVEGAKGTIEILSVTYPMDSSGHVDIARPSGEIALPAKWWSNVMGTMAWGVRPKDRTVPWAYVGAELKNGSSLPVNLVGRMRVLREGSPDPAFVPTMRNVDDGTGWVSSLIRIPAGSTANITLPLYVDETMLSEDNRHRVRRDLQVQLSPTGSEATVATRTVPVYVQRGSTPAAFGLLFGLLASAAGSVLVLMRLRHWLAMDTPTLVTIALFATLSFVVNAAAQVVGMGISSVLGPFAFLLTGLIDDSIRACLLATLLLLRPRPGVCGLAVIIGWFLRAVVLGSASPTDLLYLSGHIFFLEGFLWLLGLTRGRSIDFFRLSAAFVFTFSVSILTALSFNVVLYRLYYAEWYILLTVVMSGLVYPMIATSLALPFARSLQRVED